MRFSMLSVAIASSALPAMAKKVILTYDSIYDKSDRSLSEVTCWNPNVPGLFYAYEDWLVQSKVMPGILAIPTITGWEHPECITCWMLTWVGGSKTIFLLAVDRSEKGFVTSHRSMNVLTGGQANDFNPLEPLEVEASRVSLRNCGFAPGDVQERFYDEL